MDPWLLAVDGGGSGARVRLSDRHRAILAEASAGPANVASDFEGARAALSEAIERVYDKAGADPARRARDVAWLGLAGAGVAEDPKLIARALGLGRCAVSSDRAIHAKGALGEGDGALAHFGTGSFFVRKRDGATLSLGGWGIALGDEAGAAWLGREALRRALWAHDGLVASTALVASLRRRIGDPAAMVRFARDAAPGELGALAPAVTAAGEAGDALALAILDDALRFVLMVLDRLEAAALGRLVVIGGLAPFYVARLPDAYRAILAQPAGDGLDGATALAQEALLAAEAAAD